MYLKNSSLNRHFHAMFGSVLFYVWEWEEDLMRGGKSRYFQTSGALKAVVFLHVVTEINLRYFRS